MELVDLRPAPGAHKSRSKQVGRGVGSGRGKTAGRGHKGDKARGSSKRGFEGGQTPLHRRLPKQRGRGTGLSSRGFNSGLWKTHYSYVNVSDLERFDAGTIVTPEMLTESRILKDIKKGGVKVLGDGVLTKALTVYASKFSGNAVDRLRAVGGKAFLIGGDELLGSAVDEDEDDDEAMDNDSDDATNSDDDGSED